MPSPKLFRQDGDESREFTADEYAQHTKDQTEHALQASVEASRQATRSIALDKLADIGLTQTEIDLLFP